MAASIAFEEESGTCTGFLHPHNGYYAGDFFRRDDTTCARVLSIGVARQPGLGQREVGTAKAA